jgi:HAD superfamily hydrolase (TIGR01549 family)
MPPDIRGLLFDCGSTLWQKTAEESWQPLEAAADTRAGTLLWEYAAGANARLADSLDPVSLGAALRVITGVAVSAAHQSAPDEEADFASIAQQAAETLLDVPVDLSLGARAFEALRIRVTQSRLLFGDALPTLRTLRERGYAMGITTNRAYGGEIFLEDLREMGLLGLFTPEAIAVSADVGIRKPNPALFQHALGPLQLAPIEVAMIGDNIVADVWGAQRLGASSVWRPPLNHRNPDLSTPGLDDSQLVLRALQRARAYDSRTTSMAPPDAVIHGLSDLLEMFPPVS